MSAGRGCVACGHSAWCCVARGRAAPGRCFGLVHGVGFANALSELALDREHLLLALFSFNVGVELGQLAVVVLLALVLYWIRDPRALRRYVTFPGSVAIAASGLFLVLERSGLGPLVGV